MLDCICHFWFTFGHQEVVNMHNKMVNRDQNVVNKDQKMVIMVSQFTTACLFAGNHFLVFGHQLLDPSYHSLVSVWSTFTTPLLPTHHLQHPSHETYPCKLSKQVLHSNKKHACDKQSRSILNCVMYRVLRNSL